MPAHACDCHVHIFGPPDRYPLDANRRYTPSPAGLDEYRKLQAMLGTCQRERNAGGTA
jgi:predicted TIM-barrel fold metal-dependent hydrolase